MLSMHRDKCKIMYTDTDSLIYHIECDDVYNIKKRDIAKFYTSDYPIDNMYGMFFANKKVSDLMKNENNGAIITEFVELRAKYMLYASTVRKTRKKSKVSKVTLQREL